MAILVTVILALILWIGGAMLCAVIPAWLVMLVLGAFGFHIGYIPCLLIGTVFCLFFCEAKVNVRF
jgi:hypothetical protein